MKPFRVVIACGGTGGHLFPGLAVAEMLKERGHEVLLIVSEKEIDTIALKAHPEFRAEKLPSVGMPNVLSPAFVRFLRRSWEGYVYCRGTYRKFRPSVVLGMGGFTSTAPILAARRLKLPTLIHESNAIPGRANKLTARFATRVLLGFQACAPFFQNMECVVTGTPVRRNLGSPLSRSAALAAFRLEEDRRTLLVMGGSQGASGINQALFKSAPMLKDKPLQIIHLTGERDDRLAAANYQRESIPHYVAPFHHRMEEAYSAADLVVSRAGAASLSELSQFGLASILIPYPYATDDHQTSNAKVFAEAGAAEMQAERSVSPEAFSALIANLLSDDARREKMSAAARTILPRDAAGNVANEIERAATSPGLQMNLASLTEYLTGPPHRVHLIGVAGSGMSGIAGLLLALGHRVSGSDKVATLEVGRLEKKGLQFRVPHQAGEVHEAELIVYSSAIKAGNVAYDEARRLGIPMVRRADALAAIMNSKKGIVVCGMHGKTTTSSMTAHVLRSCGLKPSHYVGAEIPILGTNARWDSEGEFFVAEGDESDGTLINYHPEHAIVLNIEPEHLDFYKDLAAIDAVYGKLVAQARGKVVYCGDDSGATRVCSAHPGAVSYGRLEGNRYRLTDLVTENFRSRFQVSKDGEPLGEANLNIPGAHNAVNALAVIALALEMGLPFDKTSSALEGFRGARRRFEICYESQRNLVVDDYGHHPTEIAATIATARTGGWKRVLVMFQPHRYTRTLALKEQFGSAFDGADAAFIADVYPASEKPIPGVSGQMIVDAMRSHGHPRAEFQPDVRQIHQSAGAEIEEGDLILSLGAGNIHEAATRLVADLALRDKLLGAMGPGSIRLYEPLSRHTTMRVGGPAQFWAEPETEEGFADLVQLCFDEDIPFMVMGRGSNLLVRDGGVPGVVAHLARGEFARCIVNGNEITAGVGLKLKKLTAIARNAGIGGFEWMEGIPGNLGGSLRMNAGAMGAETFDQVVAVRYCDQDGNIFTRSPSEMEVHYRDVPTLQKNYALSATLRGTLADTKEIEARIAEAERKRRESQPIAASAGCIFKNPDQTPAGRLIEELGFKNFTVGRARVSEVHGNFIVNDGGATAEEILTLIEEIKAAAARERGINLETEVQIVGIDP